MPNISRTEALLRLASGTQPEQITWNRVLSDLFDALDIVQALTVSAAQINSAGANLLPRQELTASGVVLPATRSLELNHATVIIAATLAVVPNTFLVVKDTSASGTAAHTLTLTGGTFNGTATIATLAARDKFLMVHFDNAGRGQVVANVGSVALS